MARAIVWFLLLWVLVACGQTVTPLSISEQPIDFSFYLEKPEGEEELYLLVWFMNDQGQEVLFVGNISVLACHEEFGGQVDSSRFKLRTFEYEFATETHLSVIFRLGRALRNCPIFNVVIKPEGFSEKRLSWPP